MFLFYTAKLYHRATAQKDDIETYDRWTVQCRYDAELSKEEGTRVSGSALPSCRLEGNNAKRIRYSLSRCPLRRFDIVFCLPCTNSVKRESASCRRRQLSYVPEAAFDSVVATSMGYS